MNIKNKWFTLIEIIVWILIISFVIVAWFQAYAKLWLGKIKLIEKANIQNNSFYFTEKIFQLVKESWTVDYEEYFNRKVVWTDYENWHFKNDTGFWNFWNWWVLETETYWDLYYYCRSWDWIEMTWSWCYDDVDLNEYGLDYTWEPQRYWQYSYQFVDYNSNADADLWDEDLDWKITWDADDEWTWRWPVVFDSGSDTKELYLISWDKKKRTLIRWRLEEDAYMPDSESCDIDSDWLTVIWEWCRWTVEFLKLEWRDWWLDHDISSTDSDWTQYDWVIDTWLIDDSFSELSEWDVVAWSNDKNYREELFPESINITDFQIYLYPNIDFSRSWRDSNLDSAISPYVTINFKIKPSWKTRVLLGYDSEELNFSTTVNLTEIYSN